MHSFQNHLPSCNSDLVRSARRSGTSITTQASASTPAHRVIQPAIEPAEAATPSENSAVTQGWLSDPSRSCRAVVFRLTRRGTKKPWSPCGRGLAGRWGHGESNMEIGGQVVKKMPGAALRGEGAAAASATVSGRGVARDERLGVHDERGVSFLAREKREHATQGGGALDWRRASQSQMERCGGVYRTGEGGAEGEDGAAGEEGRWFSRT